MRQLMAIVVLLFATGPAAAEVVRVEIDARADVLGGRAFGLAGPYETLSGRIHFAVDPENPVNQIITDIDKAPRNPEGKVEWSSEFSLIKPKDATHGNGTLLLEVGNRGRKSLLSFFNRAEGSTDPRTEAHFGDGFLMREGYSLLWLGWQFDTPQEPGRMRMVVPVATNEGNPIRGLVRADFVVQTRESDHSLADRDHIAYPVVDPEAPETVMTVRDAVEAERRTIPREEWGFGRLESGEMVPDPGRVYLDGGFQPGRIYEVVYVSEGPPLVGLGPAGIRDVVSYVKHGDPEPLSIAKGAIEGAIGFGISQSGRFLRTYLYYGFNEDEAHRRVFDGVLSHVAGGGRGSFNHRFAQASRDAHPYLNMFYPTDIFPFTDIEQTDPETGLSEGLFDRQKEAFLPKVFYTNSSYEYWGRAASLIHTSIDGREDARLFDNVKIYLFAGTQHGPSPFPPTRTIGQQVSNPMDFRWSMRALLTSMQRWIDDGTPPPASRYPRIETGALVTPDALDFPEIPGVVTSTRIHKAYRADYGPRFRSEGIVTREPPDIGTAFPMMVSAVDADGNEIAGIRLPEQSVPLATYTGWNLFNAESGPTHELSSMAGSFLPFPRTRAEREATGDPRLSIEERYESREQYLGLVAEAALDLIEAGYLLGADLPEMLKEAGEHWDYLMESESDSSGSP